jgi:O-antigen/teichoic acid export membrane protein
LKNRVFDISEKLSLKTERTRNIAKHIGWSLLYKIGSIVASFALVPLTINYLDTENYGIWLTISSFIAWFSFFDIGLGNGLRNKFAEAKANNNYTDAQGFVSTAYFTIGVISFFITIAFILINPLINWSQLFNTPADLQEELSLLLPIIITLFGLHLVFKLILSIYQADQHHSIQNLIHFASQLLSLIVIWIITISSEGSLLILASFFSALPVLLLIGLNFFAFKKRYKKYRPRLSAWNKRYLSEITGLGFKFFIVQISALVLFSTDNFIISKLFGPEEVVPYNISQRYFSIVTIGFTILITPFWSSFTEAYTKNDLNWIKKSVNNILKIWLIIPIVLLAMVFSANFFYGWWIGDKVSISENLTLTMAFNTVILTLSMVFNYFINGVGKIQLHLYISIFTMFLNIPLSIFLAKTMELGLSGIIIATSVSLLMNLCFMPIQYNKIIQNKATGIWNK